MTDDTSPENLRKFLESDDPALRRMGLSMAMGSGVPEELLPTILELYMWDDAKTIRAAAKSVFNKHAPAELQAKVKENWKPSYRTLSITGDRFIEVNRSLVEVFNYQDDLVYVLFYPLFKALGKGNSDAAYVLGVVGDARAVQPLIKALKDRNSSTRDAAAGALHRIGDVRAVKPLQKMIEKNDDASGCTALSALASFGPDIALEPLIKVIESGPIWYSDDYFCSLIRMYAIEALGKFGGKRATDVLIKTLSDEHLDTRASAARALGKIGDARAVQPLIKTLGDELLQNLNNGDGVHQTIAHVLGEFGDKRAVEPLIKLLKYGKSEQLDPYARRHLRELHDTILQALGKIGDERAVGPIIKVLEDLEDNSVRETATKALGSIGDERAVELLIESLEDNAINEAAARSLGEIGDARAVAPLEKAGFRAYALWALRDVNKLIKALGVEGNSICEGHIQCGIGFPGARITCRRHAAEALGSIGDEQAVEPLIGVISEDKWWDDSIITHGQRNTYVHGSAARALGKIGDVRAVEPLIMALKTASHHVREAAKEALEKLGHEVE